jgi:hypothetical protein
MTFILAVALLAIPSISSGQASPPPCTDSSVFFAFQVTEPASWIADTSLDVHPTSTVPNPANLVAFTVDTGGIPVAASFRVLKVTEPAVIAAARASLSAWRYRPARLRGCPVRQRVQTPVGRSGSTYGPSNVR